MRKLKSPFLLAFGALALAACVTINVYFSAAEAQEAAAEFVDKVIGDDAKKDEPAPANGAQGVFLLEDGVVKMNYDAYHKPFGDQAFSDEESTKVIGMPETDARKWVGEVIRKTANEKPSWEG